MSEEAKKSGRLRRWAVRLLFVTVVLLVGAELVARFYLGLGTPPLSMSDPEIEYLYQPSQDLKRFGNHVKYNAYSMRSDDFTEKKSNPDEYRIMLLGDSVVNGGALTDQADLASELLIKSLGAAMSRPVTVGNISSGSWGPANLLAYVEKYGFFDADLVVLVLSSHDAADTPTFEPIVGVSSSYPDRTPILALEEAVTRYLPRYLPSFGSGESGDLMGDPEVEDAAIEDLDALLQAIKTKGIPVVLLQHNEMSEMQGQILPGKQLIADAAKRADVTVMDMAQHFAKAIEEGQSLYRDNIHPNANGQRVMAKAIEEAVRDFLPVNAE